MGFYPADFGKDRQGNIHGLDREIDPHHFFGLQRSFGFDTKAQRTYINGLADFEDRCIFPGEKPAPLQLDGLIEVLAGIDGVHLPDARVSLRGYSPQMAKDAKKRLLSFFRGT